MTRRHALLATAAILISVVIILLIGWMVGRGRQGQSEVPLAQTPEIGVIEGETRVLELFFPGPGGNLFPEEREIPVQSDPRVQLEKVLEELLAGPVTEKLYPALPPEITVAWLHLNPLGVFYVDLSFSGESDLPAWGSRQEMLAVYSIVNTILTSTPEIRSVVLLRDGQQRSTFAGHLDTSRPLRANPRLIATRLEGVEP